MRVLFALSAGGFGGGELAVVTSLRARPADVDCQAVLFSAGRLEDELAALGIPTTVLSSLSTRPLDRWRLLRGLDRTIRGFNPDLIHACGNKAAVFALPSSKLRRIPIVWHKVDSRYDRRGAATIARLCCRVISLSGSSGAVIPPERLTVIYPPVRLRPDFRVSPERPPSTIGSIGRLEPWKGHEDVIVAAGMLHTDFPDLNVVIAGSEVPYAAGYRERLQQIARGQGIEDRVEFVGHVEPVQEVLSRLTVLVQASYAEKSGPGGEAFGLALAEASWAGLPVVATRTGGIPEQVHDRVTGLLVSPRRPDELARAIHHIFSDPDLARRMGERGARQARIRFDPHEASRRLFHELKRCL